MSEEMDSVMNNISLSLAASSKKFSIFLMVSGGVDKEQLIWNRLRKILKKRMILYAQYIWPKIH